MKIKRIKIIAFLLLYTAILYSQEKQEVLLKIDDETIYTEEFVRMYEKQLALVGSDEENSVSPYFELFKSYKLKVKEARDLKLDTFPSYKKELGAYRNRLIQPYLKDEEANEYLIHEAYQRTINEVNASHILLKLPSNATPSDTLIAFNRISDARTKILNGAAFEEIAKEYSEDPSVATNSGNLGYFSAFNMLYPFETAAYNTSVGDVSKPFRTIYGYHVVQTKDLRESKGTREIAHIMLTGEDTVVKRQIDSIYNVLTKHPEQFEMLVKSFSKDAASASEGGKLGKIGIGDTIESFEKIAFDLNEEGAISMPFKTKYGWHIIKLIKDFPVPSEKELYSELKKKVLSDTRSSLVNTKLIEKLEAEYTIQEYKEEVGQIISGDWNVSKEQRKSTVLSINNETYSLEEFVVFLKQSKKTLKIDAYKIFKEAKILAYYKRHLEASNPEFRATISEFKEGLLLFNLMEKEIWNPSKNIKAQKEFYSAHQSDYTEPFEVVQGQVIADFQIKLEKLWLARLQQNHKVEVNSKALPKLINE